MSTVERVVIGRDRTVRLKLRGPTGTVITTYAGTETLSFVVWPGDDLPAAITVAASWVSDPPADGLVDVPLTAADTAIDPGIYRAQCDLTSGGTTVPVWVGRLEFVPTAGSGTAPTSLITEDELLRQSGRLRALMVDSDQAGFAEQRSLATEWLYEKIANRTGKAPDWVAANLTVTARIKECVALRAVYLIARQQISSTKNNAYADLANEYEVMTEKMFPGLILTLAGRRWTTSVIRVERA